MRLHRSNARFQSFPVLLWEAPTGLDSGDPRSRRNIARTMRSARELALPVLERFEPERGAPKMSTIVGTVSPAARAALLHLLHHL